jgi:hypothetical protein
MKGKRNQNIKMWRVEKGGEINEFCDAKEVAEHLGVKRRVIYNFMINKKGGMKKGVIITRLRRGKYVGTNNKGLRELRDFSKPRKKKCIGNV